MKTTLIILKPDTVQRGMIGRLLTRFEEKGLRIIGLKWMRISHDLAARHYEPHIGKPFYEGLVRFMTSSPVVAVALTGRDAINVTRKLIGSTDGSKAEPGTIRGDFGVSGLLNLVHGSDSPESAARELELFFRPEELVDWHPSRDHWINDPWRVPGT